MKLIFLIVWFCSSIISSQSTIWKKLDLGNYSVGFKVLSFYDSTRIINNDKTFRPIQISIWFPATKSENPERLNYKDYFLLSTVEIDFDTSDSLKIKLDQEYKNLLLQNGVTVNAYEEWFNTQMLADKNATPVHKKFPLIVVAQGNYQSAHHQVFLCEFLASYGYVVVTTPSQTRISGPMTDDSQAVESAEEQIQDMEFAIRSVRNFGDIDFNRIGLIGHSFGGRSILLLQMKNQNVRALVSLDGGLGLNTAIEDIQKSPEFNINKMNVPLLHIYEDDEEYIKPDFTLINAFDNSESFLIKINDMHHFYFTSIGFVSGAIDGFSPISENLSEKYKLICDLTRDFLNTVLVNDAQSIKNLEEHYSALSDSIKLIKFQMR